MRRPSSSDDDRADGLPITQNDIRGVEFDWFVEDHCGHIALVSTAGSGNVPEDVLQNAAGLSPIDEIDHIIANLAVVAAVTSEGRGPGKAHEWVALGQRGIFVFDWNHATGRYERIVVPSLPIHRGALSQMLQERLGITRTAQGCFVLMTVMSIPSSSLPRG